MGCVFDIQPQVDTSGTAVFCTSSLDSFINTWGHNYLTLVFLSSQYPAHKKPYNTQIYSLWFSFCVHLCN